MWKILRVVSKGDYEYAVVPDHPKAIKHGYVLHHRVIMENHIGRLLEDDEIVHHIDGNKKNNNINNLTIMKAKDHITMHDLEHGEMKVTLKCPNCGKIFDINKNQSYIVKHNKYNCTCCSKTCRGKLYSTIQYHGMTKEIQDAIASCFIKEYREFKDYNEYKKNPHINRSKLKINFIAKSCKLKFKFTK